MDTRVRTEELQAEGVEVQRPWGRSALLAVTAAEGRPGGPVGGGRKGATPVTQLPGTPSRLSGVPNGKAGLQLYSEGATPALDFPKTKASRPKSEDRRASPQRQPRPSTPRPHQGVLGQASRRRSGQGRKVEQLSSLPSRCQPPLCPQDRLPPCQPQDHQPGLFLSRGQSRRGSPGSDRLLQTHEGQVCSGPD